MLDQILILHFHYSSLWASSGTRTDTEHPREARGLQVAWCACCMTVDERYSFYATMVSHKLGNYISEHYYGLSNCLCQSVPWRLCPRPFSVAFCAFVVTWSFFVSWRQGCFRDLRRSSMRICFQTLTPDRSGLSLHSSNMIYISSWKSWRLQARCIIPFFLCIFG